MSELEVFTKALEIYGLKGQVDMCIEEMSELTKELCKWKRGKQNYADIAEEIADVGIMIDQMKIFFSVVPEVNRDRKAKVERLANRIAEAELVEQCDNSVHVEMAYEK